MKEKSCGCIVVEKDKVLLIKQVQGHWCFPKGHVEDGETEEETALREVKEETNLDVEIISSKKYIEQYITNWGNEKEVILFLAKKINGEEKAQECEVGDIKWVNFNEALEVITYDNTKELFKKVLKENEFFN